MIKQQKKKKKILKGELVEKKPSLHKKFSSISREGLSVTWPNFTVLKYTPAQMFLLPNNHKTYINLLWAQFPIIGNTYLEQKRLRNPF